MIEATPPPPRSETRLTSSGAVAAPRRAAAFDLKGTMAPLTVLRLRSIDVGLIERQLRVKIAQLPHLFLDAPVMLDLGGLEGQAAALPLADLTQALKQCKLVPVAASNVPDEMRMRVIAVGMGILQPSVAPRGRDGMPAGSEGPRPVASASPPPPPPPRAAPRQAAAASASASATDGSATPAPTAAYAIPRAAHGGPVVINQPVRSGQVVYAQNNDLVVLAPVNPGAQVIADGHVHIYAPLRGRAVAGAQGLLGARIFCQKLEAELVAISGAYVMAEEIPPDRRGKPAQIYLEGGECRIGAL